MINTFKQRRSRKTKGYTYVPSQQYRDEEVAVYRKLALTAILVIGFAIGLYLWGIPLVIELGNIWNRASGQATQNEDGPTTTPAPDGVVIAPRLNPLPAVTRSVDDVAVSGTAPAGADVAIFVNNERQITILSDASGNFEVKGLKLIEGENRIMAKTLRKEVESEPSNVQVVTLDTTPPPINLIQPENGTTVPADQGTIEIVGTTDSQARLTINEMQVVVNAATGDFSRTIDLSSGENKIKIESTDRAGNTTTVELTVQRADSDE